MRTLREASRLFDTMGSYIPGEVTILLQRWRDGDDQARQELMQHVYPHLRDVAAGCLRRKRPPISGEA